MRCRRFARFTIAVLVLSGCGREGPPLPDDETAVGSRAMRAERALQLEPEARLPSGVHPAPPGGAGMAALHGLPWEERLHLEQALALSDSRYVPRMDEAGPVLDTPGSVVARFVAGGAELSLGGGAPTTMSVVALGRDGSLVPLPPGSPPAVAGAEVRTVRGPGVVEWWRSLPSGLEHGVTIERRPRGGGDLVVEIAVRGALAPRVVSNDAVELRDATGARVAIYANLVVLDTDGARIPARMALDGTRIALVIDDTAARYPLVVDPLVTTEEATLLAPDGAASDRFGCSVALSADGSHALVGGYLDDTAGGSDAGSAHVFLRTGTAWVEEATLLAPDGAAGDNFGGSVAISADGSRALVGVHLDDTPGGIDAGSARMFLRTGTAWAQEATLLAPDGAVGDEFGESVAVSADGSRALVGATRDDTASGTDAGSARVFLRTGTAWAQEATLLAPGGALGDRLGVSVALSSDGAYALLGASLDATAAGTNAGSAHVFRRTGAAWAAEATLLAPDGAASDFFGGSVAISADGSRALVGAYGDDTTGGLNAGSARVFVRGATAWTEEATLLAADGAAADTLGISVALSADGSRALAGAVFDDTARGANAGSARVFIRSGTAWTEEATLLAPDGATNDDFAYSVALVADGSRALVGAYADDTAGGADAGSARVFTVLLAPLGSSCSTDAPCASGFCTDSVCCDMRCAGGATDCQACTAALTGGPDGSCRALSPAVAPTVVCRPSTDACEPAETCTSASAVCPSDVLASAGTVCRPPSDACDLAEACTGSSPACPADALAASGVLCRPPATGCDAPEACTGSSAACPTDAIATPGTVCRPASASGCDVAEVCDGFDRNCPGDAFAGAGTVCRSIAGPCDLEEICPGTSPVCPSDLVRDASVVCRPLASACDVAESCTGASPACPTDLFAPATTSCGPAATGACDAPDHCAGTTAFCVEVYLSGVECRASSGACDPAEVCLDGSPSCPADRVEPAGMACRVSTDMTCDPAEVCDGVAAACPADVTTCSATDAGPSDAGPLLDGGLRDSGGPADTGASGPDAGTPPVATAGCACRAGSSERTASALLGALGLVLTLVTRRSFR